MNTKKIDRNTEVRIIKEFDDFPQEVKIMASEHYEPRILEKLLSCSKSQHQCSGVCKEVCINKNFYLIVNKQFGEINSFSLIHTEQDIDKKDFGWLDFVMVKTENRGDGLGLILTEKSINFLKDRKVVNISTSLFFPIEIDGEAEYPNYGSIEQLLTWGFSQQEQKQYRYIEVGEYTYKQRIYILPT